MREKAALPTSRQDIIFPSAESIREEIIFTATVVKMEKNELTCGIEARVGNRLIAVGNTGQKMLKKERLHQLFKKSTE